MDEGAAAVRSPAHQADDHPRWREHLPKEIEGIYQPQDPSDVQIYELPDRSTRRAGDGGGLILKKGDHDRGRGAGLPAGEDRQSQ